MLKDLRNKIKLFKKVLEISKELKKIKKEEQQTFNEIKHFLESAKLLFPKLGGLIERIFEIDENDNNKKV
jgi:hypothetical protein